MLGQPRFSIDTLSYLAHGFLGITDGLNPYLHRAGLVIETPFGSDLAAHGWNPNHGASPYGPLWTWIEVGVVRAMSDVESGVLLLKAIATGCVLGSAVLVWAILGHIRPDARLLGTLAFLWNPLLAFELAGEGHNDALMILLVLCALWLAVRRDCTASLFALGLGVLTKYLPAIFAPAHLVHLWHNRRDSRRFIFALAVASAGVLVAAVVLYRGLWVGAETFAGLGDAGHPKRSTSPAGLLYAALRLAYPADRAAHLAAGTLSALIASAVLAASWRCRDGRTLASTCAWIAVIYALGGSWVWWPWYSCLPVALLVLTPYGKSLRSAMLISLCARVVAPLEVMRTNAVFDPRLAGAVAVGLGTTLPLAIIALLALIEQGRAARRGAGAPRSVARVPPG
jgi:hypothetical protein